MDPDRQITDVFRVDKEGNRHKTWSMYGWFRVAALADDGEHLIVGYDGMNLLSLDFNMEQVMLYFFHKGRLLNYVTLAEIIRDRSALQETTSHYYWGNYLGLDEEGHYLIETAEHRLLMFDPTTGYRVKDD